MNPLLEQYICLFKPSFADRSPTDPPKPDYLNLARKKKEVIDSLKDLDLTLNEVKSAEKLDKRLPDAAKSSNRHLKEIQEEFPSFFDEDSGNTSTKESLTDVKEYILGEKASLKSELSQLNSELLKIRQDGTEKVPASITEEDKNPSKRSASEMEDNLEPSSSKMPRTDSNSSNTSDFSDSDSGGFGGFGD